MKNIETVIIQLAYSMIETLIILDANYRVDVNRIKEEFLIIIINFYII